MKNKLSVLFLLFIQYYYTFATTTIENINYNNNNENEKTTGCSWPCPNKFDICQLSKVDSIMSCQPLQDKQYVI